ncbi:MAG: AMP-binding protein [Spirochaetales bacterium]|nr:AMP-binding protein [Spirochaetales bacterium]
MDPKDTVFKRFQTAARDYPENTMLMAKNGKSDFTSYSYKECYELVEQAGTGLHVLGVKRGDHIGIISDNRYEWLLSDLGILGLGAIDIPRGSDSTDEEIAFILAHADCKASFVENTAQLKKIEKHLDKLPLLKTIILFDDAKINEGKHSNLEVISFQQLCAKGAAALEKNRSFFDDEVQQGCADDIATIIYTSGTTGEPKGVLLPHRSFIFQLERIYDYIPAGPGDMFISVLPAWHSFERAVEYIIINVAATIGYSKPLGAVMLPDMAVLKPHWMASVPRIWESVRSAVVRNAAQAGGVKKALFYFFLAVGESHAALRNLFKGFTPEFSKRSRPLDIAFSAIPLLLLTPFKLLGDVLVFSALKKKLGGRFKAGISGGGALPPYVDRFFQAAGIQLLEGYGLTETGPVLSVRKFLKPVSATIGPILPDVEWRIVDAAGEEVPQGHKGVLMVKSPQIMDGYYKRQEATDAVLKDGWLDTGDLAISTVHGELKIVGRAKETIVLLGGENIEPVPIEDKLLQSDLITQVMVLGQDQKFLGALIVPDLSKVEEMAKTKNIGYFESGELLSLPEIQEQFHDEIQRLVNPKNGFKPFERIFRFYLLSKEFEVGRELTHTLKLKRNVIEDIYAKEIKQIFSKSQG